MLTLVGVLAIAPIASVSGLIGNESTMTVHASAKYDKFTDIVSAIKWSVGFYNDAMNMYKNKSKINHVKMFQTWHIVIIPLIKILEKRLIK